MNIMMIFLLMVASHISFSAEIDPIKLLKEVDQAHRSRSSYAEIRMIIKNPNWTRELKLKAWSLGTEYSLIRILSPRKDKGVSTLRRHNDMWNYFPKINREMKVPSSMMMGSWMGSDFTNDDLVKQSDLAEQYAISLTEEQKKYVLTLLPKKNTATVWGKIVIEVDSKNRLPISQTYFDEKNTKIRQLTFSDNKIFSGKVLPARMDMISFVKKDHQTSVIYDVLNLKQGLKESFFSLHNLKKAR